MEHVASKQILTGSTGVAPAEGTKGFRQNGFGCFSETRASAVESCARSVSECIAAGPGQLLQK